MLEYELRTRNLAKAISARDKPESEFKKSPDES